jgi:hypothetical protein
MAKKEGFTPKQEPMAIIVMADGTWGSLRGSTINIVTPKQYDQLCEGKIKPHHLNRVFEISLITSFYNEED